MPSKILDKNISELTLLTGKGHVSFSEIKDWVECSYRHKLIHIDKLSDFEGSVYTSFGTAVHASCEEYIRTRVMKYEYALAIISKDWDSQGYENKSLWLNRAVDVLKEVPAWLDNVFPGWEMFDAEELLYETIPDSKHKNVKFKGYIDAIIKYKGIYHLIDWKTCGMNGWSKYKREDQLTQMQLVCYDLIWSSKHNIPKDKIKCSFVTLNREYGAGGKYALEMIGLEIDDIKRKKSLVIINNMISSVKKGINFKAWKRASWGSPCKFCEFDGTKHCL